MISHIVVLVEGFLSEANRRFDRPRKLGVEGAVGELLI